MNYLLNHIIPLKIPRVSEKLFLTALQEKIDFVIHSSEIFQPKWSNIDYWYPPNILAVLKKYWGKQKT
ncbi:MAG: hypothetical protein RMJ97_12495, partial [Raineya sp.]|nr:hypothetical protein [Raineya sp.]